MQHLGPVVGQLRRLPIAHFGQHDGIFHQARIGAHDAVDVGPDPQLTGIQSTRQNRRGEVRTAAAQRGGTAIQGGAIETGDNGQNILRQQRPQYFGTLFARRIQQRRRVAETSIGDDHLAGIDGLRCGARGIQIGRQQHGTQAFANGDRFVH